MILTALIIIAAFAIIVLSIGRWVVDDPSCADVDTVYSIVCWSALIVLLLAIR